MRRGSRTRAGQPAPPPRPRLRKLAVPDSSSGRPTPTPSTSTSSRSSTRTLPLTGTVRCSPHSLSPPRGPSADTTRSIGCPKEASSSPTTSGPARRTSSTSERSRRRPAVADSFTAAGPLTYPHSFERLSTGAVIATFQTEGSGQRASGWHRRSDARTDELVMWGSAAEGWRGRASVQPGRVASTTRSGRYGQRGTCAVRSMPGSCRCGAPRTSPSCTRSTSPRSGGGPRNRASSRTVRPCSSRRSGARCCASLGLDGDACPRSSASGSSGAARARYRSSPAASGFRRSPR